MVTVAAVCVSASKRVLLDNLASLIWTLQPCCQSPVQDLETIVPELANLTEPFKVYVPVTEGCYHVPEARVAEHFSTAVVGSVKHQVWEPHIAPDVPDNAPATVTVLRVSVLK